MLIPKIERSVSGSLELNPDVIISCLGKFHHFDLARQLYSKGRLNEIISGYPSWKLRGEGIPPRKLWTSPYFHSSLLFIRKILQKSKLQRIKSERLDWVLDDVDSNLFDFISSIHVHGMVSTRTVLIGLSGHNFRTGTSVQAHGGSWICDRGSTHARHFRDILLEEYKRVGIAPPHFLGKDLEREEREYQASDAILIPSKFVKMTFLRQGLPENKLITIPYGVDLTRFRPEGSPVEGELNLIFVGNVSVNKGIHDVLEAFSLIRHQRKRLRIFGSIPEEGRQILARYSHLGAIEVMGPVPQSVLLHYYSVSDYLILPSLQEGLAMVQAQAMACGCPVISTENAGADEIYDDGVSGLKIPIRQPSEIARRIEEALDGRQMKAMRTKALERVTRIGGWDSYGAAVVAAIDRLQGS